MSTTCNAPPAPVQRDSQTKAGSSCSGCRTVTRELVTLASFSVYLRRSLVTRVLERGECLCGWPSDTAYIQKRHVQNFLSWYNDEKRRNSNPLKWVQMYNSVFTQERCSNLLHNVVEHGYVLSNILDRFQMIQFVIITKYCTSVVLKLGYSCHLWHFDQKIVTLCLYFYVTLLTQKCKENDTQTDKS